MAAVFRAVPRLPARVDDHGEAMRTRHDPPLTAVSDLCFTCEQLYSDLLAAGLVIEAACVHEALQDLRRRVREDGE